jgi:hypothetical protein
MQHETQSFNSNLRSQRFADKAIGLINGSGKK